MDADGCSGSYFAAAARLHKSRGTIRIAGNSSGNFDWLALKYNVFTQDLSCYTRDPVRLTISDRHTILSSLPMGSTATLLSFFYCLQYQRRLPLDVHESMRLWENIALLPSTLLCSLQ